MSEQKKKHKVNRLNSQECKSIIDRLHGQNENRYYQSILIRYKKLVPESEYIKALNKNKDVD